MKYILLICLCLFAGCSCASARVDIHVQSAEDGVIIVEPEPKRFSPCGRYRLRGRTTKFFGRVC